MLPDEVNELCEISALTKMLHVILPEVTQQVHQPAQERFRLVLILIIVQVHHALVFNCLCRL